MEIIVKLPSECSDQEVNEFMVLVNQGGEVDSKGLEERVRRAKKLFFLSAQGGSASGGKSPSLIAVSAIKRFYQEYKNSIFEKAGCSDIASSYRLETGWIYAKPESRGKGFGRALLGAMISQLDGQSCYTTVRSDNAVMHHMLGSHGFKMVGREYLSNQSDHKIVLYVRAK